MMLPEHEHALSGAVGAYSDGNLVVVRAEDGKVLHGEELLECITDLQLPLQAVVIRGIPTAEWYASDWPKRLEAARLLFMRGS